MFTSYGLSINMDRSILIDSLTYKHINNPCVCAEQTQLDGQISNYLIVNSFTFADSHDFPLLEQIEGHTVR